ncbi:MAG: hypothetical protein ACREIQ_05055 [Nitrospiria bacterium]
MKVLFRNIRSGKRKAALLNLNSITRKKLESDLDSKVKPALIKSHNLIVANWKHKPQFAARKVIKSDSIGIYIYPTGPNLKIWIFVDQGTRAHKIKTKSKPTLKFMAGSYLPKTLARPARTVSGGGHVQGGEWRSPVEVNHPGSEGRFFSRGIAEDTKPGFKNIIEGSFRVIRNELQE